MTISKKGDIKLPAGFLSSKTGYAAQGRYIGGDKVRFVGGDAEKMGGWEKWNENADDLPNICRSCMFWTDNDLNPWHAFGTSHRLYVFDVDKIRYNITPYVAAGTLTDPFETFSGLTTVEVTDVAHGLIVGQYVTFDNATAVGGITIDGEYVVTVVIDQDTYQIEHSVAASSSATGGGSVDYDYELAPGNDDLVSGGGWGIGRWGEGTWGTERTSTSFIQYPRFWSLDKYGDELYVSPRGHSIYRWQLNTANRATLLTNAPGSVEFMFITTERIIVALGTNGNLMEMKWSDDDDPTDWTPTATNAANTRTLQHGSRLIAGAALTLGINMIWSDTSAILMQYTGSNAVYDTPAIGHNCGLVGPDAFTVVDGTPYWMSAHHLHMYNGGVIDIPRSNEIENIFDDMNQAQLVKVVSFYNVEFNEVWWLYSSAAATENDRYVAVNLDDFSWITGSLARTASNNKTLNQHVSLLMVDEDGQIFTHETGVDADGAALDWSLETAFMDYDKGNVSVNIDGYVPDFKRHVGTIDITFTSKDYPGDTADLDTVEEEIAVAQAIVDLRHYGRQVKFSLSQTGVVGGDFALGHQRLEIGTQGRRR